MSNAKDLINWLSSNMEKNNWSVRETARKAGLSHPTISDILNGDQPSYETCKKLAKLFKAPAENIFRIAGLLPLKLSADELLDRIEYMYNQLQDPANKKSALDFLEFLMIQEERGEYHAGRKDRKVSISSD
jgi:transcriptional regulator with XRE-family HTH domain